MVPESPRGEWFRRLVGVVSEGSRLSDKDGKVAVHTLCKGTSLIRNT